MELFKSIFKISLISLIAYVTIQGRFDEVPPMMGKSVGPDFDFYGGGDARDHDQGAGRNDFSGIPGLYVSTVHLS